VKVGGSFLYDKRFLPGKKWLDVRCNEMTFNPPPIIPWKATDENKCAYEQILSYWKIYDTLTFLVDLGIYHPSFSTFLDQNEKEKELQYKTTISRKRFVVSRTIIKHILKHILQTPNLSDTVLTRKKYGRIHINDFPGIFISLSYSGTCIAITFGKQKIGSDIEMVRPVDIRKIRSYPLFADDSSRNEKERIRHFLQMWTLLEANAKLHDRSTYPCLIEKDFPPDVNFVSYCINTTSIFSLASGMDPVRDTLLWLDTDGVGKSS
jgi:4'-phosphopantetheinyl transferase